jgi:hypothetical protein
MNLIGRFRDQKVLQHKKRNKMNHEMNHEITPLRSFLMMPQLVQVFFLLKLRGFLSLFEDQNEAF